MFTAAPAAESQLRVAVSQIVLSRDESKESNN